MLNQAEPNTERLEPWMFRPFAASLALVKWAQREPPLLSNNKQNGESPRAAADVAETMTNGAKLRTCLEAIGAVIAQSRRVCPARLLDHHHARAVIREAVRLNRF